jgi:hypothetical protein
MKRITLRGEVQDIIKWCEIKTKELDVERMRLETLLQHSPVYTSWVK